MEGTPQSGFRYAISGIGADGRRIYERVAADSAADAVEKLRARGLTDIELHQDDLDRSLTAGKTSEPVTARDRARINNATALTTRLHYLKLVFVGWLPLILLAGGVLLFRRAGHFPFGWPDLIPLGLLMLPLAYFVRAGHIGRLSRRIRREGVAARWDVVLKLLPQLERAMRHKRITEGLIASIVLGQRAKALMALGRRDEALAVMEVMRTSPGVTADVYWIHLGFVHLRAYDHESFRRCCVAAAEANPLNPAPWLGLATVLAQRLHKPAEARAALNRLKQLPTKPSSAENTRTAEALVLLAEGNAESARDLLMLALNRKRGSVHRSYAEDAIDSLCSAYLCIACAQLGRMDEARKHFKKAEPFYTLHGDKELLDRCRRVIGALPAPG